MSEQVRTAVVTGASRGFGRAIAAALVASGTRVVGIARDSGALGEVATALGDGFTPVAADVTAEGLAESVLGEYRPSLLVLNAGAAPYVAPVQEQSWESFSRNWHVDTRHVFEWTKAALLLPLAPGSVVVSMSSGAAIAGSPLSGGYASAKAAIRYIRGYAADEAGRAGLGLRFTTVLPQLSPSGIGDPGVDAYAARGGIDRETFLANMAPLLTPELVAKAVLEIAADPGAAPEYVVGGAGFRPVE
ncbi:MAG TPA: SDR family oxidoreductase [Actinospica sp.]|jgi:NAD(P)-dependent dehydrogenase (short-subunit alcohol dehydrogenase family)|nr:SDR family oxidoreductase [Actinospica sp.]